jgi:hypothetical protein
MRSAIQFLVSLALLGMGDAQSGPETRNWFNDPFFQVTNAVPRCPAPAGPFMTEAEKLEQTHHRAEKGTTCWLAGKCSRPNSYAYDQDIAEALKSALTTRDPAPDSTLWVTVQGRVVYFEGCVRRRQLKPNLKRWRARSPTSSRPSPWSMSLCAQRRRTSYASQRLT